MNLRSNSHTIAKSYRDAGLCVLPATLRAKRPDVPTWKPFQQTPPQENDLERWFGRDRPMCVLTGAISGNLEMLDFDLEGELFSAWADRVLAENKDLLERLVIETSQSGGRHVVYRCEEPVCGNLKLAVREILRPDQGEVTLGGKRYKPRKRPDGNFAVYVTLIESRGEGGLFLCAPSPGYSLLQGRLQEIPVLTAEERDLLLSVARSLTEFFPPAQPTPAVGGSGGRPGDDFNVRGDVRALLLDNDWTLARSGENEYWRRPGKRSGWSATLKNGVFYVFSSNADPFEPDKAYCPFAVYALLEHDGDYSRAAAELRHEGYGEQPANGTAVVQPVTIVEIDEPNIEEPDPNDPGPVPDHLLRVPGFINAVMNYTLETAPYPERTLAFCGALALQAVLAGRKVRDQLDNRTNLYLLGLANSGAGKEHPRKVNQRILLEVGLAECLGNTFASGEGLEDRLFAQPASLFQVDEIDGLLLRVSQAKDARHEQIVTILLQMYSSANSLYVMRAKADRERTIIDQPSLCVFGTAVPKFFYEAITARMMTNGFLARMIILEAQKRGRGRDAIVYSIPESILQTAKWWSEFLPGDNPGNLSEWHPVPRVIEQTAEASEVFRRGREQGDLRYSQAEKRNDPMAMALWARAYEKARRLALIYACSADHVDPLITGEAAAWGIAFVEHQTQRMLFMAGSHSHESDFDAKRKRLLEVLSKWRESNGDKWMPFWAINRKLPWTQREHEEVRETLVNQRLIEFQVLTRGGRPGAVYRTVTIGGNS